MSTVHVDTIVPSGEPWMGIVRAGQLLRIVDLEGNQAVDTLFYNAADGREHYSATNTIRAQGNIYLTEGSVLLSNRNRPLLRIVSDTCGRHDTLGGACSAESNTVRYALEKRHMHNCRDSFLAALAREDSGLTRRDLPSNINFFMNVPVEKDGTLGIVDGISAPGLTVDLRAEMDVIVVVSNCPQINNPCNAFNPTPVRMIVTA